MVRVKGGMSTLKRKKKIFKISKGYRLGKKNLFRHATEQVDKGLQYAYRDRKVNKRTFRALWIVRINAGARLNGISYNKFMNGLKLASIDVDRKMLAELAVNDSLAFAELANIAKKQLNIE
ncbi:50S ribosomal protein L20 [bacterium]